MTTTSVAIVTYNRPEHVVTCLEHVAAQDRAPDEVVVVDSSEGDATERAVTERFPEVRYLRNPAGRGTTATARAIAYRSSSGEVIAFLDDDAFARPDWLERLVGHYADPEVGAVGGRTDNDRPGEAGEGIDRIGRLEADGSLTGFFGADPGHPVDVDHLIGANLSVRRAALDAVGGIRDRFPGTCMREETDICLRVASAGYRLVYDPAAVVRHVAGPYARGRRFDMRYAYFAERNHLVLLSGNYGWGDPRVRRYLASSLAGSGREVAGVARALRAADLTWPERIRRSAGHVLRALARTAGLVSGVAASASWSVRDRRARARAALR